MGSDAEVYVFDDAKYRSEVIPALHQLIETGDSPQWLSDLIARRSSDIDVAQFRACGFCFAQVCHFLGDDFSFAGQEHDPWSADWNVRSCKSKSCSARDTCPLHNNQSPAGTAEDFNVIHECCVVARCVGRSQFVGRTVSPMWYADIRTDMNISQEHRIHDYLRKLEYRGFVIGYQFSNSDGIHGWLTAEETSEFSKHLNRLDLPEFEPSFERMKRFHKKPQGGQSIGGYTAPPPYDFKHLSLAFVRSVCTLAESEGKGVLWGNDLITYWLDEDR